jgi:hypothetical protein
MAASDRPACCTTLGCGRASGALPVGTGRAESGVQWPLPLSCFFVLHLSRVEIHESARSHGVADEDIQHALAHTVTWVELGDDPWRYLLAGPDRAGNMLELVILDLGGDELVIHAMGLRRSTAQELFGDE